MQCGRNFRWGGCSLRQPSDGSIEPQWLYQLGVVSVRCFGCRAVSSVASSSSESGTAATSSAASASSTFFSADGSCCIIASGGQDGAGNCGQEPEQEKVEAKVSAQAPHHQVPRIQRPTQRAETGPGRSVGCGDFVRTAPPTAAALPPVAVGMAAQISANHPAGQSKRRHGRQHSRSGQQFGHVPRCHSRSTGRRGGRRRCSGCFCIIVVFCRCRSLTGPTGGCGFEPYRDVQQWCGSGGQPAQRPPGRDESERPESGAQEAQSARVRIQTAIDGAAPTFRRRRWNFDGGPIGIPTRIADSIAAAATATAAVGGVG